MAATEELMRAAVLRGPGRIEVVEVPVPEVGDDELLVAVELCGICGTDLHMVIEGWGRPGSTPGHEWTGTVAAVGADVYSLAARRPGGRRTVADLWAVPLVPCWSPVAVPAAQRRRR